MITDEMKNACCDIIVEFQHGQITDEEMYNKIVAVVPPAAFKDEEVFCMACNSEEMRFELICEVDNVFASCILNDDQYNEMTQRMHVVEV